MRTTQRFHQTSLARVAPAQDGLDEVLLAALGSALDGILVAEVDPGLPGPRIVYVNAAFERMTGWTAAEIVGRSPAVLHGPRTEPEVLDRLRADLAAGRPFRGQLVNHRRDGTPFTMQLSVSSITDTDGRVTHHVAVQRDVTEWGHHLAEAGRGDDSVDALTGAASRAHFSTELASALADPAIADGVALVSIDVDHLKLINDHHGHPAGDAVLREVVRRIREVVRRDDVVARTGGEEFAVLAVWDRDDLGLLRFAERIRRRVERAPVRVGRVGIGVTISIGVARAGEVGGHVDTLVAVSDRRLYRAKRLGRNRVVMV